MCATLFPKPRLYLWTHAIRLLFYQWDKVEILTSCWFWKQRRKEKTPQKSYFKAYFILQKTCPCGWFPIGAAVHMFLTMVAIRPAATLSFLHPQTNIFSWWSLQGILEQYNNSTGWAVRQVGEAELFHFQICYSKFSLLDDQYKC